MNTSSLSNPTQCVMRTIGESAGILLADVGPKASKAIFNGQLPSFSEPALILEIEGISNLGKYFRTST